MLVVAETPMTSKRPWYGRNPPRPLPKDKRSRHNCTGRTLETITRDGAENSYEDRGISYTAQSRRTCWFYLMGALSLLPFIAPIVLTGVFDDTLSWFTKGEVSRLTIRQRFIIKVMFVLEIIVYAACVAGIVVYFVTKDKFDD
jgi:hypothetical protein